jgi:hypothetical protein
MVPFVDHGGARVPRRLRCGRSAASAPGTLLDRTLLRIVPLRAGLLTLVMQHLLLLGTFFVLPVYLQVVLGLDAFETGASLGTALIGAVLIGALTTGFVENVEQNPAIPADYCDAQLQGLKFGVLAVAAFALLSLWCTRRRPGRVAVPEEQAERVPPDLVSAEAP